MAGFSIDLSNVQEFTSLSQFSEGFYVATIKDANTQLDENADSELHVEFEISSETQGTATIKQKFTKRMGFMLKPLWLALNDLTKQEFDKLPDEQKRAEIKDTRQLIGETLIVHLQRRKGNKLDDDGNPRYYLNITSPFFLPASQYPELLEKGLIQ